MNHSHQTAAATLAVPQIALRQRASTAPSLRSRLLGTLGSWLHRNRSRRDLAALDDHLLRDIGLTRSQVETESSKAFWRI